MEQKAYELARQMHAGQTDRAGKPYILHPVHVAAQMDTETEKAVALLHDTVEDSELCLGDLRQMGFPEEVTEAVQALTKAEGEPYFAYLVRVKANPLARKVKLADLAHNMDLSRLEKVTEEDLQRLEKYRRAQAFLLAGSGSEVVS